jgi:hypothetical protein
LVTSSRKQKTFRHDPTAFRYYVSALHTGREERHLETGERGAGEVGAWKLKWERRLSDEDKKLMAFTNKLRREEVRVGGPEPSVELGRSCTP